MPRLKGELPPSNLTEIEEGKIKPFCFACRSRQETYVRINNGMPTHNKMGCCTNEKCFRYTDPDGSLSWVREDKVVFYRRPEISIAFDQETRERLNIKN